MFNLYMSIKILTNPEILYFSKVESIIRNFYLIRELNVKLTDNFEEVTDKRYINLDKIQKIFIIKSMNIATISI